MRVASSLCVPAGCQVAVYEAPVSVPAPTAAPAPVVAASEPVFLLPETGVDWKVLLSWPKVGAMLAAIAGGALVFALGYAFVRRRK